MTKIELMMLSICFGVNLGWILSGLIILTTDGIKAFKKKAQNKEKTANQ